MLTGFLTAMCVWTKPVPAGLMVGGFVGTALLWGGFTKQLHWKSVGSAIFLMILVSVCWAPFHIMGTSKDNVSLIFDTSKVILEGGWKQGFSLSSYMGDSSLSFAKRLVALVRSEAAHSWFTVIVFAFALWTFFRVKARHSSAAAQEILLLLGFSLALNAQSLLYAVVHFSDSSAGYSLPPTILLFALCARQWPARDSSKLAWVVLAFLLSWSALFLMRHPIRWKHSQTMVEWNDGALKGILMNSEEHAYYEAVRQEILQCHEKNPPMLLIGYIPALFNLTEVSDIFPNDIYTARRAFDRLYENSPSKKPMQIRLEQALRKETPELVVIVEEYVSSVKKTPIQECLDRSYHPVRTIPVKLPLSGLVVYRRNSLDPVSLEFQTR